MIFEFNQDCHCGKYFDMEIMKLIDDGIGLKEDVFSGLATLG